MVIAIVLVIVANPAMLVEFAASSRKSGLQVVQAGLARIVENSLLVSFQCSES